MIRSYYWVGYDDASSEKLDYPADASAVTDRWLLEVAIKDPEALLIYGPYTLDELPAAIGDCTDDKKMKG